MNFPFFTTVWVFWDEARVLHYIISIIEALLAYYENTCLSADYYKQKKCKNRLIFLLLIAQPSQVHYTWRFEAEWRANPYKFEFPLHKSRKRQQIVASTRATEQTNNRNSKMWPGVNRLLTYFWTSKEIVRLMIISR